MTFCLSLGEPVEATDFQAGNVFTRNIPEECREKLHDYAEAGHEILCVSFPPEGGNRWTIVTDRLFFNRGTGQEVHDKMWEFRNAGHKILCVAYPPAGGNRWAIITDQDFFTWGIPAECHQKMQELHAAGNPPVWLSFPPEGGNSWSLVAQDGSFVNRTTPLEFHERMWEFRNAGHKIRSTAFHPDGGNRWVIVTDRGFYQWGAGEENFRVMRSMRNCLESPLRMTSFHPGRGFVIASTRRHEAGARLAFMDDGYLDLDDFAEKLHENFTRDSIGKFAFVIRHGDTIRSGASGEKRSSRTPPAQAFTIYDRFNPASVSKWVTAVGLVHALQGMTGPGESVEDVLDRPILAYLPPSWSKGAFIDSITFREVLSHRSGLRNPPSDRTYHDDVKTVIENGINLGAKSRSYANINYGLARVLLASLAGYRGGDPEHPDASVRTASTFRDYLQDNLFDMCGIYNVQFEPDPTNPTVFYPVPSGDSRGNTYSRWTLRAGSAGIFLSVAELSVLLDQVSNSNAILRDESRQAMDDSLLGWDRKTSTAHGSYLSKGGYFPASEGNSYSGVRSTVMKFEDGTEVTAVLNTGNPFSGDGLTKSIQNVYDASWKPLPPSIAELWQRPTLSAFDEVAAERDALQSHNATLLTRANTLEDMVLARDASIAKLLQRPTQAAYDTVAAERDARFTEDQIRALSADYTIGLNAAGNVQMKFNLFESSDLATFTPFTVNPDSVSVVDGSICLEFTPEDRAAFFRFSME